MTRAHTLYLRHDKATLLRMMQEIDSDPNNLRDPAEGSIYLLNDSARKKSEAIALAISMHMEDERALAGRPVPTAGYSGRKSNHAR